MEQGREDLSQFEQLLYTVEQLAEKLANTTRGSTSEEEADELDSSVTEILRREGTTAAQAREAIDKEFGHV